MATDPQTPTEKFEAARLVHLDINAIASTKIIISSLDVSAGLLRAITGSNIDIQPETEAAINQALLSAFQGVLDTQAESLNTQFDNIMNNTLS